MSKIEEIIRSSLESGIMTQRQHDEIMLCIQADGEIDPQEQAQLSTIFSAVRSGAITIVDSERQQYARSKDEQDNVGEATRLALERESTRHQSSSRSTPEPKSTSHSVDEIRLPEKRELPLTASPSPAPAHFSELSESVEDTHSISSFLDRARSRRTGGPTFELHNDRLLDVNLNGKVWMKTGAMVGYYGIVKFTREGVLEHGVSKAMKKAITGEGAMLTKASGQGNVYLADRGKKVSILRLGGHSLVAAGSNLLAFEETVQWDISFMKQLAAIWSGGLFNVRMSGQGHVALTTYGDPVVLRVTPAEPVMTDVHATVAWSGSLAPQIKADMAMKTLVGRASGETLQMRFEGDGFVIIQPFEELPDSSSSESV